MEVQEREYDEREGFWYVNLCPQRKVMHKQSRMIKTEYIKVYKKIPSEII